MIGTDHTATSWPCLENSMCDLYHPAPPNPIGKDVPTCRIPHRRYVTKGYKPAVWKARLQAHARDLNEYYTNPDDVLVAFKKDTAAKGLGRASESMGCLEKVQVEVEMVKGLRTFRKAWAEAKWAAAQSSGAAAPPSPGPHAYYAQQYGKEKKREAEAEAKEAQPKDSARYGTVEEVIPGVMKHTPKQEAPKKSPSAPEKKVRFQASVEDSDE